MCIMMAMPYIFYEEHHLTCLCVHLTDSSETAVATALQCYRRLSISFYDAQMPDNLIQIFWLM